jgi:ribosomal protein S18 acetylase RimI-like enzyme
MIIRKANEGDVKDCTGLSEMNEEHYWEPEDFKRSIEDKDTIFLVAEEDEDVVGYTLGFILPTKRTEALIHATCVSKQERGRGIGTKLVDAFCEEVFKRGVDIVLAEIEQNLLGFYRDSCSFVERGKWIEVAKQRT